MSDQSPLASRFCLDIPATLKYLHLVGSCLDGILTQENDLSEPEILSNDVQLAVQEICTNIVRHAYSCEQSETRITVEILMQEQPKRLTVDLFDTGRVFDASKVQEPDLENGQIHGYGLFLVKNLMDDVSYCRHDERNCWHLVKNLERVYVPSHN